MSGARTQGKREERKFESETWIFAALSCVSCFSHDAPTPPSPAAVGPPGPPVEFDIVVRRPASPPDDDEEPEEYKFDPDELPAGVQPEQETDEGQTAKPCRDG